MKNRILLLFGLGISTLGDFIYLIAINVLVLQMTGSAAAVAGLWMIGPIASLLTKFWIGSLVDRWNIRRIMMGTDLIRALFVAAIPFIDSIWLIYGCLFILSVAKSFFEPASLTYITSVVPQQDRKQFNSFRSLITSGAFLVGPAISGILLLFFSVQVSIWLNAISFLLSLWMIALLPDVQKKEADAVPARFSRKILRDDWKAVMYFSRHQSYIVLVYFLAQLFMIIALGMDAQEVVFIRQVLDLSEADYGLLVSLTGVGSVLGAFTVSAVAKKLSIRALIGTGFLMVSIGYLIYAFSFSFFSVATGFMILGFFNAFSNTGIMTFFQNNVPVETMGRISSVYGLFQSVLQIVFILLVGFTGDIIPVRYSIIGACVLMGVVSMYLMMLILKKDKQHYFVEESYSQASNQ
ncbi:MFS transporter [Thalassobacillus hwangdonensis]|uniref:MFS transporter n=1 Tax=Thalassobacillus hwangdonensis TaxID=546108 RepID=A0ABW3L3L7_9BACI